MRHDLRVTLLRVNIRFFILKLSIFATSILPVELETYDFL